MTNRSLNGVMGYLRRTIAPPEGSGVADAALLERFLTARDEAAFELLVYRHGPMVFGVCRRVLQDVHDAEDAFQATMLVLARKAGSIGKWSSVSSWLYKVAYRTALRVKAQTAKRARFERGLVCTAAAGRSLTPDDVIKCELQAVLDEELHRLPEKYRLPIVLCYLEGRTNEEAARQLRWSLGTVKTRLTRARELLGVRLTRRGFTLSAGALTTVLAQNSSAGVPVGFLGATVHCAVRCAAGGGCISTRVALLTEGVLNAMYVTKIKMAAAVVLAMSVAATGAGVLSYSTQAAEQPDGTAAQAAPNQPPTGTSKEQTPSLERESRVAAAEDLVNEAKAQFEAARARLMVAQANLEQAKAALAAAQASVETHQRVLDQARRRSQSSQDVKPPEKNPPVAYIYDAIPITRQELGEYLIARSNKDKLDALINERIIDHACKQKGIQVTADEVEAALSEDLKTLGVTRQEFVQRVLAGYHKTLMEWKHDVIRHRLLMTKLCRDRVTVSEDDIRKAFESLCEK